MTKYLKIGTNNSNTIATNLQHVLRHFKITEVEIAQALNIPVMTIKRLTSGETTDPRVSTLKLIANYLNITVDSLINDHRHISAEISGKRKPYHIPILDWTTAEKMNTIHDIDLTHWKDWESISFNEHEISDNAFGLISRPSMYPRFSQGTIFIIDPNVAPSDGDIVLVRINKNNELTLRELIIDPPNWQLQPIILGSTAFSYTTDQYTIVGIVLLTMSYNRK